MFHELLYRDPTLGIHLKQLRYELSAFRRDELGNDVAPGFDLAVQIRDVVVVEGEVAAQQRVQQHAYNIIINIRINNIIIDNISVALEIQNFASISLCSLLTK